MNPSTATQTIPGHQPNDPQAVPSGRTRPACCASKECRRSYQHNAARMLLRRSLLSWLKRSKAETFYALRNVSFDLGPRASLAVVGANGAGKSTLLRCATGITFPDAGRFRMRGTIAALMELGAGFHPDLTGAENVVLNASLLGLDAQTNLRAVRSRSWSSRVWPTLSTSRCAPIPAEWSCGWRFRSRCGSIPISW